jgi:hypothetical protein
MMQHRVDTLHLAVRTPAGREAEATRLAERFARDVVEQFSQIVEARWPARVVLIRRIALRWSVSETEMADPTEAANRAAELADTFAVPGTGSPHANDTVAVFEDEAGWLASWLRECSRGVAEAWFHAAWREAEKPAAANGSALRRETVLAALSRLLARGELAGVLAGLPPATVTALAAALGSGAEHRAEASATRGAADASADRDAASGEAEAHRRQPDPARGASLNEDFATGDPPAAWQRKIAHPPAASQREVGDPPVPDGAYPAAPDDVPDDPVRGGRVSAAVPLPSGANAAVTDVEAQLLAAVAAAAQRADDGPPLDAPASLAGEFPAPGLPVPLPDHRGWMGTRYGGLFYLLSLALELGIGEALWKVCLPEGLILAQAAAALLGPDAAGDPAAALFGGLTAGEMLAFQPVSNEQQAEVCVELLAATAAALPRYSVAPAPEAFLDLVPSPAGRMLVALTEGPLALFAWPAPDARAAAAGVDAFLGVWPGSFPAPRASNVLVNLDTSGRLRAAAGPTTRSAPFLPPALATPAAALLAQVCGALVTLFALRAGDTLLGATEVLTRYLAIPARVERTPEAMTVVLPMGGIDVGVRRAALDRDPGWVAWLQRTVRIEFSPEGAADMG